MLDEFARIDFTRHECEAIRELATFFDELTKGSTDNDLRAKQLALRGVRTRMGHMPKIGELQPVDLDRADCAIVYDCAEFVSELLRAEFAKGVANLRAETFRAHLQTVKMKATCASELFPKIARVV
jgi:hypothetical protein